MIGNDSNNFNRTCLGSINSELEETDETFGVISGHKLSHLSILLMCLCQC